VSFQKRRCIRSTEVAHNVVYAVFAWLCYLFFLGYLFMQIRRVDPTLDMEADEGDDYIHLPVCFLFFFIFHVTHFHRNLITPTENMN
jgi:hypothetical protein